MKHISYFTLKKGLLMAGICLVMGACSDDNLLDSGQDKTPVELETHTIAMKFIGDIVGFDQQSSDGKLQTRASSTWTDGDKIYLTFHSGSNTIPGEATYSTSSGWSVNYHGNLEEGSNLKCEARYFVNATSSVSSLITLNPHTEIYEATDATYSYNEESLTVQASMTPKTGRIRFTGTKDAKIYITGLSVYTTFSPENNQFFSSSSAITTTVASNGSTPYVYGAFTDTDRNLGLIGSDFAYTRKCTSDILRTGESGYMAIPSESSHNNWLNGLNVKASGVEFKMIPVRGYSGGFFLIGETEVTEALYKSVNGSGSSSQKPISNVSYTEILSTIEKLNFATKLNFSLPTEEQWEYAAKGGDKSLNYTYAGSNYPGDVAWYVVNCSGKQNVKTLMPNELGIYDMSGNVEEFTSTVGSYYHIAKGGSYVSSSDDITIVSREDTSYDTDTGFRLILTFQ